MCGIFEVVHTEEQQVNKINETSNVVNKVNETNEVPVENPPEKRETEISEFKGIFDNSLHIFGDSEIKATKIVEESDYVYTLSGDEENKPTYNVAENTSLYPTEK